MKSLGIVVMASGFSSRFGEDNKLLMPLGQKTVIETTVNALICAGISKEIAVVTQYDEVATIMMKYPDIKVIMNPLAREGISRSIKLGISGLNPVDGYMFLPADQIGIRPGTLKSLKALFEDNPTAIIIPEYGSVYGSPKIFPARLKNELLALGGDEGGKSIIMQHMESVRTLPVAIADENTDIDTYEDYLKALQDREEYQ